MIAPLRLASIAAVCACLSGCAAFLPALGLNLAAQGAKGLVAVSLGPLVAMQESSEEDRCAAFARQGLSVVESLETTVPSDEGKVDTYEPAHWRHELASEGYPQTARSRPPTEGALVIGERSVNFVPPPGATRVSIPHQLVQDVEIHRGAVAGEPDFLIVRSCSGRFDIVTFPQRQPVAPDQDAAAAAAARLKSRVAATHATPAE